jgi:hypothetical protein
MSFASDKPLLDDESLIFGRIGVAWDVLAGQVSLLEEVFGRNWFNKDQYKKQQHPAFIQWNLCHQVLAKNSLDFPKDREVIYDLASTFLNCSIISISSGGSLRDFSLGSFANYGDAKVQARIHHVKTDAHAFLSLLTELGYAAWHLSKGSRVTAFEDDGLADFRVESSLLPLPIIADCKFIQPDTQISRFHKIINKANKQIKAHCTSAFGIVIMDVTAWLPRIVHNDAGIDAPLPAQIQALTTAIQKELESCHSSVSGAVLIWDELFLIGSPVLYLTYNAAVPPYEHSIKRFAQVVMLRRSELIRHHSPKVQLPSDDQLFRPGSTYAFRVFGA